MTVAEREKKSGPASTLATLRAAEGPVLALVSAGEGPWSRRSVVARPGERIAVESARDLEAFFRTLGPRGRTPGAPGGWIGWLAYELGGLLEPAAGARTTPGPVTEAVRGPVAELWRAEPLEQGDPAAPGPEHHYRAGPLRSAVGVTTYTAAVRRALEYIRAGDVYQVNLTHPLRATFEGSARALAADAIERTGAWYGGCLETPGRTIVSTSPELLASVTPNGRIVSRPIKGTRPAGGEADLEQSDKDAAELAMIVDLMRNDLGRVCRLGGVRVEAGREIEAHAAVAHGVATVAGELRPGVSWEDILRAVFPAGSITGAPKVRAMQIVSELEPEPRGVYCGSLAWFGDDGSMDLSVAIRTAEIAGDELRYGVGAGIVADSDPESEWRETLDKARGFAAAVGATVEAGP